MSNLVPFIHLTATITAAVIILACIVGMLRCHIERHNQIRRVPNSRRARRKSSVCEGTQAAIR